jgi:hypothetical protein
MEDVVIERGPKEGSSMRQTLSARPADHKIRCEHDHADNRHGLDEESDQADNPAEDDIGHDHGEHCGD